MTKIVLVTLIIFWLVLVARGEFDAAATMLAAQLVIIALTDWKK